MSKIRTFIAVDVDTPVRERSGRLIEALRGCGDVKWVDPGNLHLTLKFLGDVLEADVPHVCKAVQRSVTPAHPFRISLRGAGAFPSANRPRTIWIGVDQGADQLQKLQKAVEDGVKKLGFPRERRSFHPHLTIGRIRRGGPELQELTDRLLQQESYDAGSATIDQVVVYASYLEKSGPTYSAMSRIPLTGSD